MVNTTSSNLNQQFKGFKAFIQTMEYMYEAMDGRLRIQESSVISICEYDLSQKINEGDYVISVVIGVHGVKSMFHISNARRLAKCMETVSVSDNNPDEDNTTVVYLGEQKAKEEKVPVSAKCPVCSNGFSEPQPIIRIADRLYIHLDCTDDFADVIQKGVTEINVFPEMI